jgi:hypothetical protein
VKCAALALYLGIKAAHQFVFVQDRQTVVPPPALGRRLVGF